MLSILRTIWYVFLHSFQKRITVQYPEEKPYLAPRYRGRIILSRDPDGGERCVACNLCAVACPVDCIALQATEDDRGGVIRSSSALTSRVVFSVVFAKRPALLTPSSLHLISRWESFTGRTLYMKSKIC